MTHALPVKLLLAAPGLALAAGVVLVTAEGPSGDRVVNAASAGLGVLLVWSVAVAVRSRYPQRPLGTLLFALAGAYALQTLTSSPHPFWFTLARAARPAVELLLIWVMLAFPSGELQGLRERWLVRAGAASVVLLWLPGVMFSSSIPLPGPFVQCAADCPRNLLFVAERPEWSAPLLRAFRAVGALILIATASLLFGRLRAATPLMRRALAPVLLASIARALNIGLFLATGGAVLALTFTFWAVPLAIAFGLFRGRLYTARTLQRLVSGLRDRPSMQVLRTEIAEALDDPALDIAYWMAGDRRWVNADRQEISVSQLEARGLCVRVIADAQNRPVAALIHDASLLEEPMLLDAIASSMQSALDSHRIENELVDAHAAAATAAELERRRIERDLHDGAQQRLLALRMKLGVTSRLLEHDPRRAAEMLVELGSDVDAALVELRTLAHGIVPPLLVESGLALALIDVAERAPIETAIDIHEVGRFDPGIERAVYFCCLEALQNAVKHAGPQARATLSLRKDHESLVFCIADDGVGLIAPTQWTGGQGVMNMRERMSAIGGVLDVRSVQGAGLQITGVVSGKSARPRLPS